MLVCGFIYWWWQQPRTAEEMFRARCSACHELQLKRLCEFPQEIRADIVKVMRREHGAADVISEQESLMIQDYLKVEFKCQ